MMPNSLSPRSTPASRDLMDCGRVGRCIGAALALAMAAIGDLRAELISSRYLDCVERVLNAGSSLEDIAATRLEHSRQQLDHARSRLRLLSPAAVVEQNQLRLDDLANRLGAALRSAAEGRRTRMVAIRGRLAAASPEKRVQLESHRLLALWKRLESVSPQSVLKRGFVVVRDEAGRPVSRAKGLKTGQSLVNEFADGQVRVRTE